MNNIRNRMSGGNGWRQVGGLLTMFVAALAFVSCDSNRPEDPYISVRDPGVTIENIMLEPNDYIGKQVTVAGTIKGTFGEKAFLINGEKLVDELLAVGADPYPDKPNDTFDYSLAPVHAVRVTGVVRRLNAADIERETGVKLDGKQLDDFAGKPVLIVKSLERAET